MRRCAFAVVISIGTSIFSSAQNVPPAGPKVVAPMQPVLEALHKASVSGSVELSGHCDGRLPPHFPHMRVDRDERRSLLQSLTEMFAGDPAMHVTQDPDGTIRMIESGVPTDLLNIKINHISFESNGVPLQYAAFGANSALLHAILKAPEVLALEIAHSIAKPPGEAGTGGNAPHRIGSPHIVGSLDNLTLSQALDSVLKTFPGIWVYEDCSCGDVKDRCVFLRFLSLQDPGLVEE